MIAAIAGIVIAGLACGLIGYWVGWMFGYEVAFTQSRPWGEDTETIGQG